MRVTGISSAGVAGAADARTHKGSGNVALPEPPSLGRTNRGEPDIFWMSPPAGIAHLGPCIRENQWPTLRGRVSRLRVGIIRHTSTVGRRARKRQKLKLDTIK